MNVYVTALELRNKGYKSVFTERGLSGFNIPEKAIDFAFLSKCTNLIKDVVYKVFEKEYIEIDELFNSGGHTGTPVICKRDYNKEYHDLMDEMKAIQKTINARF